MCSANGRGGARRGVSTIAAILLLHLAAGAAGAFFAAAPENPSEVLLVARIQHGRCKHYFSYNCSPRRRHLQRDQRHLQPLGALKNKVASIAYAEVVENARANSRQLSKREERWWERFHELIDYKRDNGNCIVPQKWSENPQLATWVYNQRKQYRLYMEGKISQVTEERIALLESIGFEWVLRTVTEWEVRFEELKDYQSKHGHCNVPQKWNENPQLGRWVNNQRAQYRLYNEGKKSLITEERIALLESIGFVWDVQEALWQQRFNEMKEYQAEYGNCNVRRKWSEHPQLGIWVMNQRAQYRLYREGKESQLTEMRIALLESIGFEWVLGTKTEWEVPFEELKVYKSKYGNCNVPQKWNESPQLGNWVMNQRAQYRLYREGKKSLMTEERISSLESIGFEWVLRTRSS